MSAAKTAFVALASLSLILLIGCHREVGPAGKPNILLIVADDLGYNDLAANSATPRTHTPTLDMLARQGVRFTQHYAESVCSPARAALLTGMHPARLGYVPNGRGISPQIVTLAEALQSAGYRTLHVGKWHVGDTLREAWPDRQGFEHWFGFLNQWHLSGTMREGVLVPGEDRHWDPWLVRDGDSGRRYSGFLDDILADEAVSRIQALAAGPDPWFLNLWFYSPHSPITPHPDTGKLYPDTLDGRYRAMVHRLDENIARVLQALEQSGQTDSTIVILVSDNGAPTPFEASNRPFHGVKTTLHEGALRTPLLIRWPDGADAGTIDARVVRTFDILPTILGRVGVPPPEGLDGRDLGSQDQRSHEEYWEMYSKPHFAYSVLDQGRWRLYKTWPWTPWEQPPTLMDVQSEPGTPIDRATDQFARFLSLQSKARSWQRDLHRPRIQYQLNNDGTGMLTGLDFLRTPGFGGFTFGIGALAGYSGAIAEQEGIWALRTSTDGSEVIARFGQHTLKGKLSEGACHSIVVSGWFGRRISSLPAARDHFRLTLYLDGVLASAVEADGTLDDSRFSSPTVIGTARASGQNRSLSEPVLLNSFISPDSIDWKPLDLHEMLCVTR